MKIHSINYRKKENYPNKSLSAKNIFQSEKDKDKDKTKNNKELIINPIKLDILLPLNKDKTKPKSKQNINKKNIKISDNNKKIENEQELVPQKILKFNKKSLSLKKKNLNQKNIKIYQNALMDQLQVVVSKSNYPKINRNINNEMAQMGLTHTNKNHSLFNNYRDYQKEFFYPAYNVNLNNNFNNLHKIKSSTISPVNHDNLLKKKKNLVYNDSNNNIESRSVTNILQRKFHGDLPIFLNSPVTFIKNFKSNSEKERDEKNSHALFRLRDFLDIYWDKRAELVSEFFSTYQINNEQYYTKKNLENFANFIYDNIKDNTNVTKGIIETRIPMKEIIDKGIHYNAYSLRRVNPSKTIRFENNKRSNRKNRTTINWFQSKIKKKNNIKYDINLGNFRKSRTMFKNEDNNTNSCFYLDNYINNEYQMSDRETNDKIVLDEKIEKYRKYLDKNYGAKVNNKFMRKYNQKEKDIYFNKRKVGTIDIANKDNLVNNINKQSNFYKLKSTNLSIRKSQPIYTFSEKDYKELYNELKEAKQSYVYENKGEENNNEDNVWIKMYEDDKRQKFEKHPELVLKKKKKLLEYIIFQNIKERKEFEKDLLK